MNEKPNVFYRIENNIGIVTFDQPDAKVNVLSTLTMQRLDVILGEAGRNKTLKAVIFMSGKKDTFIAGADIKEIDGIVDAKEGEEKSRSGQTVLDKIEDLTVPTIAVIDGAALGGGCELALACRYRVATFNEKVAIGLPEVKLGIIPGFGGTYRLPKIVGLSQALTMILTGKTLNGQEAYKTGLVDRLFPRTNIEHYLREFIEEMALPNSGARKRRKKQNWQKAFLDRTFIGQAISFRAAEKSVLDSTKGFYPAPLKAVWVLMRTQGFSRKDALSIEAKAFGELVITDISKNLIKLFYLTEQCKKFMPSGAENITPRRIDRCAVLGAGVMGGGIAQLLSDKGVWVRLKDVNNEAIAKGFSSAYKVYQQLLKKKKLKRHDVNNKMGRITSTLNYSGFRKTDMVIEAVVENMEVKKSIFKELGSFVSDQTIVCSNTSALSVTEMAQQSRDSSKVVGFHFFNPVHRMPLVEIIKTDLTSIETVVTALHFARRLGKTPIVVRDSCGFLVNRILLGYVNEAGRILVETGEVELIDRLVESFGVPMGPFRLSDEVGLDVGIKVLHILEEAFGERFKPTDLFEKIYEAKFFGKKSGKGFYLHGKKADINSEILPFLQDCHPERSVEEEEDLNRMIYIMVNEAARCLEEGIVDSPGAVDIGMIMGTGFPPFRGGLLRYADSVGLDKIVDELNRFSEKFKTDRFKPCRYLLEIKDGKFYKS